MSEPPRSGVLKIGLRKEIAGSWVIFGQVGEDFNELCFDYPQLKRYPIYDDTFVDMYVPGMRNRNAG